LYVFVNTFKTLGIHNDHAHQARNGKPIWCELFHEYKHLKTYCNKKQFGILVQSEYQQYSPYSKRYSRGLIKQYSSGAISQKIDLATITCCTEDMV